MESPRNIMLDTARGIAILCVFYGHFISGDSISCEFVNRFHLPVFYLISGILFKPTSVSVAVRKTIANYFLPFCLFWLMTFVVMLATYPMFGFVKTIVQHIHPNALLETFVYGEPKFNRSLWFLYSLGLVYFLSVVIGRLLPRRLECWVLLTVSLVLGVFVDGIGFSKGSFLPLHLESVPMALFFFTLGRFLTTEITGWRLIHRPPRTVSVFLSFLLFYHVYSGIDSNAEMVNMHFGRFASGVVPSSIVGIAGVLMVSYSIADVPIIGIILRHIGRNSLIYFACEACVANKVIEIFCLKTGVSLDNSAVAMAIIVAFVKVILVAPFVIPISNILKIARRWVLNQAV